MVRLKRVPSSYHGNSCKHCETMASSLIAHPIGGRLLFALVGLLVGYLWGSNSDASGGTSANGAGGHTTNAQKIQIDSQNKMMRKINAAIVRQIQTTNQNHPKVNEDDQGWNTIHVYYGNRDPLLLSPLAVTPEQTLATLEEQQQQNIGSQFGQDEIVLQLLNHKPDGYFIDLAAHDATTYSNTYRLEGGLNPKNNALQPFNHNLHWTGLCLEACPLYWRSLAMNRRCHVIGAAVGRVDMEAVPFAIGPVRGWEGIAGEEFDNRRDNGRNDKEPPRDNLLHPYFTVSLATVLKKFDTPAQIDYLSLDVEGAEHFVMSSFPFDQYQISVITIERPKTELVQLLESHNYTQRCVLDFKSGETLFTNNNHNQVLNFSAVTRVGCGTGGAIPTYRREQVGKKKKSKGRTRRRQ